jgi:hypothetical protein
MWGTENNFTQNSQSAHSEGKCSKSGKCQSASGAGQPGGGGPARCGALFGFAGSEFGVNSWHVLYAC